MIIPPPLVLVHGLWDTPKIFSRLINQLNKSNLIILTPNLPHDFGRVSLRVLAEELDRQIEASLDDTVCIDLLGFSMGGLISRVWLQQLGGSLRTRRFISVGVPHSGTFTAQFFSPTLLAGVAEMKRGSTLLRELNSDLLALQHVDCISFFTRWDLMVFPGWEAVLSDGLQIEMPVFSHKGLISNPQSLKILQEFILMV